LCDGILRRERRVNERTAALTPEDAKEKEADTKKNTQKKAPTLRRPTDPPPGTSPAPARK